jgi:integrase
MALAECPGTAEEGEAAKPAIGGLNEQALGLDPSADLLIASKERVTALRKEPSPRSQERDVRKPGPPAKVTGRTSELPKATEQRVRLNNRLVAELSPGMYWDGDEKTIGFGVRVYPAGGRSFFIDYRLDGRQRRYTIGAFPRWSADAARERAKELRKAIDLGQDPAGERRERREAPTIGDLIERYIRDHLAKKTTAEHRKTDERRMLAEIGKKLGAATKVADVHGGDIADIHRRITESGRPVRANRVLALASKMFSMTLTPLPGENTPWRNALLGNPCKGVAKNHEEGRERFYSRSELSAISEALNEYGGPAADCMRLVLLTGCRPSEAMQAQWRELDAEPGLWIKPSAHTKQRKTHNLTLGPGAIELVERLRERRKPGAEFVFPSWDSQKGHLATLYYCWKHIKKHAGLRASDRVYDLRHSFAAIGASGGLGLPIIGRLLGHTSPRTTQKYAHVADEAAAEAAARINAVITGAGKPGAPVVPLRGRRS